VTAFDLGIELLRDNVPVAAGVARCVTGLSCNPLQRQQIGVPWDAFGPIPVAPGQKLALRISARIGTNPDNTRCTGPGFTHASASRLRVYYDSNADDELGRDSTFSATIVPGHSTVWHLRSNGTTPTNLGGACPTTGVTQRTLSKTAPTAFYAKCQDSAGVSFAGGNPFKPRGTYLMP